MGRGRAAPSVFADARLWIPFGFGRADRKSQPNPRPMTDLPAELDRERFLGELVRRHEAHGFLLENPRLSEFSSALDHEEEPHILPRRAREPAAPGEEARGLRVLRRVVDPLEP